MRLLTVSLFVTVSLSAAFEISGGHILELILHCSQPWYEDEEVCPEACRRWPQYCYYAIAAKYDVPGTCELPPYPRTGGYIITDTEPTGALADFTLTFSCPRGYRLNGQHPRCINGGWSAVFPGCVKDEKCVLSSDPSVTYTCDTPNGKCPQRVRSGERVLPECSPGFMGDLFPVMHCMDGSWDYIATCHRVECGTIISENTRLRKRNVMRASDEAPWHVSVYNKIFRPYKQICGGSLISPTIVISVAHCFWSDQDQGKRPAADYAVAVGKFYHSWDSHDEGQKSDISDIHVPPHFRGSGNSFQSDIAVVTLKTLMVFNAHVRPVCVDFNFLFDEQQLQPGNVGKIAAWSLTPTLKVVEMSYVTVDQCFVNLPPDFWRYITSDKICAAAVNGTALCPGDSGGGLVFPWTERGDQRWYLRGVVSTAPRSSDADSCFPGHAAFTHLLKHEAFITKLITN